MAEQEEACMLANVLLDVPNADPDDELRILSRQLLRRHEELAKLSAELAAAKSRIGDLEQEKDSFKKKLALIFDQGYYTDSYGVPGSHFSVCRWCGGGSGPCSTAPFKHNGNCLLDDDALEEQVAAAWDEVPALNLEITALQAQLVAVTQERDRLATALRVYVPDVIDAALTEEAQHG